LNIDNQGSHEPALRAKSLTDHSPAIASSISDRGESQLRRPLLGHEIGRSIKQSSLRNETTLVLCQGPPLARRQFSDQLGRVINGHGPSDGQVGRIQ
jgi:hypothetical protein